MNILARTERLACSDGGGCRTPAGRPDCASSRIGRFVRTSAQPTVLRTVERCFWSRTMTDTTASNATRQTRIPYAIHSVRNDRWANVARHAEAWARATRADEKTRLRSELSGQIDELMVRSEEHT